MHSDAITDLYMFLLATESSQIISKFQDVLLKKGPSEVVRSLSILWDSLVVAVPAPLLIVLDLALVGGDVKIAIAETRRRAPAARILVVAADFSPGDELAFLGAGVAGCCGEQLTEATILRIVDMVLDGGVWISHAILPLLLRELQGRGAAPTAPPPAVSASGARLSDLTPREQQIARLVGGGASNKLIARELNISDRTVKAHLGAIFQKLGTPDRLQLALFVNGTTRETIERRAVLGRSSTKVQ